jgi:hypothetical protein
VKTPTQRACSRRDAHAIRRDAVEVPLTSLVAASAVWIVGLVAFFFAGRLTGHQSAAKLAPVKAGVGTSYLVYGASRSAPPEPTELKPCWVTRQPTRWLPSASRSIPFDMRAGSDSMELGLAVDEHEALGLVIDPRSGKFEEKLRKRSDKEIVRVMPMGQNEGFLVSEEGGRTILPVGTSPRLFVVLGKDAIGASDSVENEPTTIWPLEGDDTTTAESVLQAGLAVPLRHASWARRARWLVRRRQAGFDTARYRGRLGRARRQTQVGLQRQGGRDHLRRQARRRHALADPSRALAPSARSPRRARS